MNIDMEKFVSFKTTMKGGGWIDSTRYELLWEMIN